MRGLLALLGFNVSDIGAVSDTIVSYENDIDQLKKLISQKNSFLSLAILVALGNYLYLLLSF